MTLDYVALAILIAVALILFYGVIVIHDIPYEIAKERRHPHQDAIHYAGWVSLFTCMPCGPCCGSGRRCGAKTADGGCAASPTTSRCCISVWKRWSSGWSRCSAKWTF
ncbi:GTPase [Klebsiella quasipneumoniae]|nr:GTPase [Klebsiella quasipneumoniae]